MAVATYELAVASAQPPAPALEPALATVGRTGTVLGMVATNLLLALLTLGIYSFWGRVRIRRYLWGTTRLWGEPLEYTGTGGELFKGAMLVAVILVPLVLVAPLLDAILFGIVEGTGPAQWALTATIFYLAAVAGWRALRYRLSRTQWRGIRGHLDDGAFRFANNYLGWLLLSLVTLGLTKPLGDVALSRRTTRATTFGTLRLEMEASGRDMWRSWLGTWLLLVPTLGMSYFWYMAKRDRYLWSRTRAGELSFAYSATGGEQMRLSLGNFVLLIVTLGLAAPVCTLRYLRLLSRRLEIVGRLDPATLGQSQGPEPGRGEGLASAIGLDGL